MYAGKSKYLLKYATGKYEAYIPEIDTRSGRTIQSRDGEYCTANKINENEDFETRCEFCSRVYNITKEDLEESLKLKRLRYRA